jgi:hypothetical protein
MRKILFLLSVTAILCVPAVAIAANPPTPAQLAAQICRSIRAQDGKATFRQVYHSFAGCLNKTHADARQDLNNAARTCKAERSGSTFATTHDGKTFKEFYGSNNLTGNTNGAGANAFGKCVSIHAKQNGKEDVHSSVAATKTCKTMRSDDLATFQTTYGTGRNALGKCVSKLAHATS